MNDLIAVEKIAGWTKLKTLVLDSLSFAYNETRVQHGAAGIARMKSAKSVGVRMGDWLSLKQAQALLNSPDIATVRGLRDRAIIAVLLGCGLRRSEVAALTFAHVQQRDGRWCIVDLVGKHGRVRTVPMPNWVKVAIDTWTGPAGVSDGYVFRSVNRDDKVQGTVLSEKVVLQMLRP